MSRLNAVLMSVLSCLLLTGSGCSADDSGVSPVETATFAAGDGAEAVVGFNSVDGELSGALTKVGPADGVVTDDVANVSGTYAFSVSGPAYGDIVLSLPLDQAFLPAEFVSTSLQPQVLDPASGIWVPVGSLTDYDPDRQVVAFVVPLEKLRSAGPHSISRKLREGSFISLDSLKYRVGLTRWTEAVTKRIPGSQFTIVYYPPELGKTYSVKSDSQWNSTSGAAVDPSIPDFVEDLDAALNQAYVSLLALNHGQEPLFASLTEAQRVVHVGPCGESAGLSPMGGPMKISNSQIANVADLKGVAGHELVHVFQGRYFMTGRAGRLAHLVVGVGSWLWFIEGSANYFSAGAQGMTGVQKDVLYGRNEDKAYLSQGLSSGDDQSYYMTAHFMDFITEVAGADVISAVMKSGRASQSVAALSSALLAAPPGDGAGAMLEKYAQKLVRFPEDGSGMNLHLVSNLLNFQTDTERQYLSGTQFSSDVTFIRLSRLLPPLSAAYVEARVSAPGNGLLVIDTTAANRAAVSTFTWDRVGATNSTFTDALPIEDYSEKTPVIKDFGHGAAVTAFCQMIVNTDVARHQKVDFAYYRLIPAVNKAAGPGSVVFDLSVLGNIPPEYIRELHVMKQVAAGTWEKLGSLSRGDSNIVTFVNPAIVEGDTLMTRIVDRYGNIWPELQEGKASTFHIGCHDVVDGQDKWACDTLQWAGNDPESDGFVAAASQRCLDVGYRQYYAVVFEDDPTCRQWCSERASAAGTCLTPADGTGRPECQGVPAGSDACINGECYNCCENCSEGLVFLFSCADGCYTSAGEMNGKPVSFCDCN